jgi:hypothetical protein
MEGAWMTKHKNKYYLQYGAPATEFRDMLDDGALCQGSIRMVLTNNRTNPFSYKPGGFARGSGHGANPFR